MWLWTAVTHLVTVFLVLSILTRSRIGVQTLRGTTFAGIVVGSDC